MGEHTAADLTAQVETAAARAGVGLASVQIGCRSRTSVGIHGEPTLSVRDGLRLINALGVTGPDVEHFGESSDGFSTVGGSSPTGVLISVFCRYEGPLEPVAAVGEPVAGPFARAVRIAVEAAARLGISLSGVQVGQYADLSVEVHPENFTSFPVARATALVRSIGVSEPHMRGSNSGTFSTVRGQNPEGLTIKVFCRFEDQEATSS